MTQDPVESNPRNYSVVFENDRVRVLEYRDVPGTKTIIHRHPDSVMITASAFRRRLTTPQREMDVQLPAGAAQWLPAQEHVGENTGDTETHVFFVELKEAPPSAAPGAPNLGPAGRS